MGWRRAFRSDVGDGVTATERTFGTDGRYNTDMASRRPWTGHWCSLVRFELDNTYIELLVRFNLTNDSAITRIECLHVYSRPSTFFASCRSDQVSCLKGIFQDSCVRRKIRGFVRQLLVQDINRNYDSKSISLFRSDTALRQVLEQCMK